MDRIHRLPFLLGGSVTVLTGVISYLSGSDSKAIYIRMAVIMVVFYVIGIYIKNTIQAINSEIEEKKRLEEIALREEIAKKHEKKQG